MNYNNPELLNQLASEYALGTMTPSARQRFERLLGSSQQARDAVQRWQQDLGDLVYLLPEEAPPARVWQGICRGVDPQVKTASSFVRWWAWAATFLAGILGVQLFQITTAVPGQERADLTVSFVNEASLQPLWVVSLDMVSGELSTQAITAQAQGLDRVYELWMLPAQGNPRSLGLLPVNGAQSRTRFSPALLELIKQAQGLAVSVEPQGGSPTGVPTGPVVYQSSLVNL